MSSNSMQRLGAYVSGQLGTKFLFFIGIVVAARAVGPAGWGLLTAALAAGFMLVTVVNLGLNPYVTREVAARRYPLRRLASAGIRYRIALSLVFAGALPIVLLTTVPRTTIAVAVILTAYLLADSWAKYIFAFLRGAEQTRFEVLGGISEKAVFAVGAAAVLIAPASFLEITVVAAAFAAGALAKLAVALYGARLVFDYSFVRIGDALRSLYDIRSWSRHFHHIRESAPFLFMAIFSTIYFRIDSYMLATLASNEEAGFYGAAYRLIEGLLFAPESVLVIFTPTLVRAFNSSSQSQSDAQRVGVVSQVAALQAAIVGSVAAVIMLEPAAIIRGLYDNVYDPAGPLLLWLGPAFIFMGFNFLIGGVLTSTYKQNALLAVTAVGVVLNIAMNWYAIPRYGGIGAAVATVITEGAVGLMMFSQVPTRATRQQVIRAVAQVGIPLVALIALPGIILRDQLVLAVRIPLEGLALVLLFAILVRAGVIPNPIALFATEAQNRNRRFKNS